MKEEVEPRDTYAEMEERGRKFNLSHNAPGRTPFEQGLVKEEKEVRWQATKKYIHGIQGIDGGVCTGRDQSEKYWGDTNAAR